MKILLVTRSLLLYGVRALAWPGASGAFPKHSALLFVALQVP